MRILFVTGDLCDGGAQRVTSVICSELADRGHDVYLLILSKSEKDYPVSENAKLIYFCDNYETYKKTSHVKRLLFIREKVKNIKPDIGIGFLQGGYALYFSTVGMNFQKIASARVDPKRILNATGIFGTATKYWFRLASAVVLQTNSQKDEIFDKIWHNCTVIENPISKKAEHSTPITYDKNCKKFVMAGRLESQKNYSLVIQAMSIVVKQVNDIQLFIYGQGCLAPKLQEEIDKNNLQNNVILMGWSSDIIAEYHKYDAYVLSSDYEGMPNSLMEAMAVGLPCISTDCETGPRDLITNNQLGILVETNSVNQMADAILNLSSMDKESRELMGTMARRSIIERLNVETITDKWEDLFKKLLNLEDRENKTTKI